MFTVGMVFCQVSPSSVIFYSYNFIDGPSKLGIKNLTYISYVMIQMAQYEMHTNQDSSTL